MTDHDPILTAGSNPVSPNIGWVGRCEGPDTAMRRHAQVSERTAATLGVPVTEIVVEEVPEPDGVVLVARWIPDWG